eukprot:1995733-Lingulodinium_polyedra.AAC.1
MRHAIACIAHRPGRANLTAQRQERARIAMILIRAQGIPELCGGRGDFNEWTNSSSAAPKSHAASR